MTAFEERRLKLWRMDPCDLMGLYNAIRRNPICDMVQVVETSSVPLGSQFVACEYDPAVRGFWVVFAHESFDPVAPGGLIPVADEPLSTQGVRIEEALAELGLRREDR